jgi:hypothetical protein
MAKQESKKQMIFTTELVDDATNNINDGIVIKRYQNPWLKSEVGIRRSGVTFKMTSEEQQEYVKCALDIHHFTENYCKVKREDGTVGPITLRDYQKEILDNFIDARFNILMASRQVGKCVTFNTEIEVYLEDENRSFKTRIGHLYYDTLSKYRKLTIIEKLKIKLYDLIYNLNINI